MRVEEPRVKGYRLWAPDLRPGGRRESGRLREFGDQGEQTLTLVGLVILGRCRPRFVVLGRWAGRVQAGQRPPAPVPGCVRGGEQGECPQPRGMNRGVWHFPRFRVPDPHVLCDTHGQVA